MQTSVAPATCASHARSATSVDRQRVGIGVAFALRERAEPAAGIADVGEVDVAVDDERDVVADGVAAQRIRQRRNGLQRRAVGGGQCEVLVVGAVRRIALGGAQRRGHVGVDPLGSAGRQLPHLLPDGLPVAERAVQVTACGGQPSLGVDSRVQIDPPERFGRLVGLLPGPTDGVDVERETGVGIGKRGDMALHAWVYPWRAPAWT